MDVTLKNPITFDGVVHSKLILDFDELSGQDLINATKETKALGDQSPVIEFSKIYLSVVVAKAAKVPVDLILALKAKDFTLVTLHCQNFLLDGSSEQGQMQLSAQLQ